MSSYKFTAPDGKGFSTKAEWRNYMMATFYSFQNKNDEPAPLVKLPGDIGGNVFEIFDCKNSTMVLMDHSEQVQIDRISGCRVFIPACASTIFIRNCENCTFYVCSRQLRLTEVTNCIIYALTISEVHIELSSGLKFAPFNGAYPQHAEHLKKANLDPKHNLWYDVFDHSDSEKTHANWKLLPEAEYEPPWFPAGAEVEFAVPRVNVGSVVKAEDSGSMQSFGADQLRADAKKLAAPPAVAAAAGAPVVPPPIPAADLPASPPKAATTTESTSGSSEDELKVLSLVQLFSASNDVEVIVNYTSKHSFFQESFLSKKRVLLSRISLGCLQVGQ